MLKNSQKAFFSRSCVFTSLVAAATFGTIYDLRTRNVAKEKRNQLLMSFSIYTNGSNLLDMTSSRSPTAINCLYGIRVLSIISIMFLHSFFYRILTPFRDEVAFSEWLKTKLASTVSAANISVDSFFVISATLVTRSMLRELQV